MPPMHPGSPIKGGDKPKRARKAITLETKLSVLKKSDEGMRVKDNAPHHHHHLLKCFVL